MFEIDQLSYSYGSKQVLKGVSFSVNQGDCLAVIGHNGSGKSTLLRLLYGLMDADSGSIFFKGKQLFGPSRNLIPGHPNMKFVAQNSEVQTYHTVAENIGQFLSNLDLEAKQRRINELANRFQLTQYLNRKPLTLSGGELQRLAIARALAQLPEVLILDEAFNQQDAATKFKVCNELFALAKENGITVIFTSHDVNDVLAFSNKVLILNRGSYERLSNTIETFEAPKNEYQASLFGVYNLFDVSEVATLFGLEIPSNFQLLVYPQDFEWITDSKGMFRVESSIQQFGGYVNKVKMGEKGIVFFTKNAIEIGRLGSLKIKEIRTITKEAK